MKQNRTFARLCLCVMLAALCIPLLASPARAASEGYWELTGKEQEFKNGNPGDEYYEEYVSSRTYCGYRETMTGGFGTYTLSASATGEEDWNTCIDHGAEPLDITGQSATVTLTISEPELRYEAGERAYIRFEDASIQASVPFCNPELIDIMVEMSALNYRNIRYSTTFRSDDGFSLMAGIDYRNAEGKHTGGKDSWYLEGDDSSHLLGCSEVSAEFPQAEKHGDTCYIIIRCSCNSEMQLLDYYEYTWVEGGKPLGGGETTQTKPQPEPQRESITQEVHTDADRRAGESGTDVDSGIVDGSTAVRVAAGAGAILIGGALAGGAGGGGGDDTPPGREEKKKRYRMYFRKSFGDTLRYGAAAQPVYARMVEIDRKGREISRDDLTAQIQFSSRDGSLAVQSAGISGNYASALVSASAAGGDSRETGILSVSFRGEGGSFQNNISFRLQQSRIVFAQEELILPAQYEQPARLPFGVGGATAASIVTAVIEPQGVYDVAVEPGDDPQVFYAVITERGGRSRPGKSAGEHEDYVLHIRARLSADHEHELMGSLPVCRFFMGLCVDLDRSYVGCYLEPKAHRKGLDPARLRMRDLQPSVTQIHTALFTWDEEEHTLLCIPVAPSAFEIVPADENDTAAWAHIQKLQIACTMEKTVSFRDYAFAEGAIACTAGILDAPLRHQAILRIRAEYGGKAYTHEEGLALLSQPYRELGADQLAAYQREDARLLRNLQRIQEIIDRDGYYQNLFPLYRLIDTMRDAYRVEFGFDPRQYELCRDVFDRFMRGDLLGANAKPEVVTLADEMLMFVTATLDQAAEVEDSMGFLSRMALGVATLGMADATLTGLRVLKEVKDYAERGGDSALEGFFVGVRLVTAEYITGKLMGAAMELGGRGLKQAAEIPSVQNALGKVRDDTQSYVKQLTGYDISAKAKRGIQRMQTTRSARGNAKAAGRQALEQSRARLSPEEARLQKAYQDGLDIGQQKVHDLQAAYELMEANPTPENIALFRSVTRQVQADEYAMYEMMKREDLPEVCAAFNRQLDVVYQATDRQVREALARKHQVSVEDVEVFCASSRDKADLLSGRRVTKDRDVTLKVKGEYLPQAEAEQLYQQSLRDHLSGGRVNRDYAKADPDIKTDLRELDAKLDRQAGKRYDQAVVQKESLENYGSEDDLRRMVNPEYYGEALEDSLRVRNTVKYKGQEWLEQGYAAAEAGDYTTALAKRKEGMRQTVKQFRIADGRNSARFVEHGSSRISGELRTRMAVVERCIEDTSISPSAVDSALNAMGTTFEEVLDQVAELFPAIG